MEQTHAVIYFLAKLVELAGVAIIVGGTLLSSGYFLREGVRGDWRQAYDRYRANLGRGILLGLELLVGADIMSTVTAPLTFKSLGLLAAIVVIRILKFLARDGDRGLLALAALSPHSRRGDPVTGW